MFGEIVFDPAALLNPSAITFTPESGASLDWIAGQHGCSLPNNGPGECWLLNYISFPPTPTIGMDPIEQTLAIVTATAGLPGQYSIEWSDQHGSQLYFFGLTEGPGANLSIINASFQVVPEPTTGLLVGLGSLGLALRRRRAA